MKNFLINIALFIGLSLQHGLFAADALEKQLKGATSESEYEAILTQAKSLNLDARGQEKAKLRSIISAAQTALTSLRSTATAAATATATRGADTERSAREFKANIEKLKAALLSKSIAADAIRTKAYDEAIRDLEAIANQAARTTDELAFQKLQDGILAAQKAVAEAQKDAERKEKEEEAAVQNEAAVKAFLDGMKTGGQAEEREVASSFSPVKDELLSTLQERFEKEVEKVKAKKAAVEQQKKLATETARKKALELQIDAEKKKSEDAETAKRQAEKEKADAQVLALAAEKLRLEEAERNKEALEKAKDDLLAQYIPKATHLLSLEVLDNESLKQATEHHMSNLRELAVKKLREGGGAYSDPEIQSKMNEIALQSYNLHPELYKDALQRILKEEFCSRAEITPSVCAQIIYEDPSIDEPFKTAAIELAKLKFQLEVEAPSQEQVEQILIELISSTAGYMDAKKTAILDALYKKFTPSADEILAAQVRAVQEARGKQSVKGKTPTYDTKKAEILATIGGEGLNTLDGQRAILINLLGGEAEAAQAIRQKAASLLDQTGRDSVAELDKAMLANAQAAAIARLRNKIISEQDALTAAEVARLRAQAINLWEEQASKESKFIKVDLVAAVEAYCQQLNFVAGGPFSEVKKQSKQELAKQVVGQSLFKEKTAASQSAAASTAVLTSEWQTVAALKESVGKSQDLFNADSMVKDLFGFWFQQYVSRGEQSLGILEGLNEAEQRSLVAIVLSKCELLSTKDSAYDDFPVAIANCAPYKSLSEMCKSLAASLFLRYQDITKLVGLVNKTLHSCIATDPVDSYKDFVEGIATESFEQPFGVKRLSEALCGVLNDPKNGIKVFNLDGSDADFQSKDFNNLITQVLLRVVKPLVNVVLSADRNLKDRGPIFATYVRQMLSMLSRSLKYDKMLIANWFERLALDASFWTTEDNSIVGSADEPGVSMLVSSGIQDGLYEAMERCAPSDDYREDLKSLVDFISLALYDALDFVQTKGLIAKKLSSLVKDKPYLSAIGAAVDYLSEESAKIAALEHFGRCSPDSTVQKLYKYMVSIKDALLEAQSAKDLLAALKKGKSKNDLPEYAQMKLKTTGAVATIKSATAGVLDFAALFNEEKRHAKAFPEQKKEIVKYLMQNLGSDFAFTKEFLGKKDLYGLAGMQFLEVCDIPADVVTVDDMVKWINTFFCTTASPPGVAHFWRRGLGRTWLPEDDVAKALQVLNKELPLSLLPGLVWNMQCCKIGKFDQVLDGTMLDQMCAEFPYDNFIAKAKEYLSAYQFDKFIGLIVRFAVQNINPLYAVSQGAFADCLNKGSSLSIDGQIILPSMKRSSENKMLSLMTPVDWVAFCERNRAIFEDIIPKIGINFIRAVDVLGYLASQDNLFHDYITELITAIQCFPDSFARDDASPIKLSEPISYDDLCSLALQYEQLKAKEEFQRDDRVSLDSADSWLLRNDKLIQKYEYYVRQAVPVKFAVLPTAVAAFKAGAIQDPDKNYANLMMILLYADATLDVDGEKIPCSIDPAIFTEGNFTKDQADLPLIKMLIWHLLAASFYGGHLSPDVKLKEDAGAIPVCKALFDMQSPEDKTKPLAEVFERTLEVTVPMVVVQRSATAKTDELSKWAKDKEAELKEYFKTLRANASRDPLIKQFLLKKNAKFHAFIKDLYDSLCTRLVARLEGSIFSITSQNGKLDVEGIPDPSRPFVVLGKAFWSPGKNGLVPQRVELKDIIKNPTHPIVTFLNSIQLTGEYTASNLYDGADKAKLLDAEVYKPVLPALYKVMQAFKQIAEVRGSLQISIFDDSKYFYNIAKGSGDINQVAKEKKDEMVAKLHEQVAALLAIDVHAISADAAGADVDPDVAAYDWKAYKAEAKTIIDKTTAQAFVKKHIHGFNSNLQRALQDALSIMSERYRPSLVSACIDAKRAGEITAELSVVGLNGIKNLTQRQLQNLKEAGFCPVAAIPEELVGAPGEVAPGKPPLRAHGAVDADAAKAQFVAAMLDGSLTELICKDNEGLLKQNPSAVLLEATCMEGAHKDSIKALILWLQKNAGPSSIDRVALNRNATFMRVITSNGLDAQFKDLCQRKGSTGAAGPERNVERERVHFITRITDAVTAKDVLGVVRDADVVAEFESKLSEMQRLFEALLKKDFLTTGNEFQQVFQAVLFASKKAANIFVMAVEQTQGRLLYQLINFPGFNEGCARMLSQLIKPVYLTSLPKDDCQGLAKAFLENQKGGDVDVENNRRSLVAAALFPCPPKDKKVGTQLESELAGLSQQMTGKAWLKKSSVEQTRLHNEVAGLERRYAAWRSDGDEKYATKFLVALVTAACEQPAGYEGPLLTVLRNLDNYYRLVSKKKNASSRASEDMQAILMMVQNQPHFAGNYSRFRDAFLEFMKPVADYDVIVGAPGAAVPQPVVVDFDEAAAAMRMDHSPGLANTSGNDCFINTMLQCVFSSPELVNYIHSVVNSENNASAVSTEPVLAALKAVFNQYFCAHKVDHSVLALFHKALRFAHPAGTFEINSQGDPAEAFNVLFGKLADVLPMTDGQVVQSKTLYDRPCEKCNATSFSAQLPEPCYPLNLAAGTIADLIQRDTAARHEDHIECANCSVPHGAKHYVSGTRRTIIVPNSPYLAFSLKRVALGGRKITTPVVIDDNIVIPDSEHVAAATYQVVAIGEHAGGRAEGGHWNVFKRSRPIWDQEGGCFIPGPTAWECCNDDSVEADIDVDLAALNSKAALVIYERVAGGEPRDVAAAIAEGEGKRPGSPVEAAAGVKIAQEQAARLIQAAWRGFSVRKTRRDNPRGRKDHLIEEAAALKAAQEGQRKADMLREQAQRELAVEKSKMQADADLLREEIRALRAAQQEARPQGNRSEVAKLRIELAQLKATAVEQKRLQDELAAARAEAEKNARLLLQLQAQMRAAGVPVDVAAPGSVRLEPPVDVRGVVEPPALVVVPEYEKYARLLKMGQPVEQLKLRAAAEGLDPNMIDQLARAQGVPAAVALPVAQDQGRVGDAFVEPVVPRLPLAGTQNFLGGIADGRRGLKKGAEKPNVVRQDKPLGPKQGMLDAIRQKKPVDDAAVEAERKAEKMSDFTSEVNRIFGKDSRNADKVSQCLAPAFLNNVLVREQLSGDLSARLQAFLTEYKASLNAKPKILKGLIEAILTGKVAAKMAALLVPPVFKEGDIMEYITQGYDTWLLAPTARKDDVIKLCRDNLGKGLRMARLPVKNEIVRLIATGKTIETITEYMQANLTPAVPKPAVQEQQTAVKPRIQDMLEARGIRRMVGYSDDEDGSNSDEEWDA